MKFVFASDSFKGSLSCGEIHEILERCAAEIFPGCECVSLPMADGGEGTTDAVVSCLGGELIYEEVQGPLGESVRANYGKLPEGAAILEMASASGLPLVPKELRNPLNTSTYGTGQLIIKALEASAKTLTIGVGGSATNDGGMGCARALGVKFYDKAGNELEGKGSDLELVDRIDISGINPLVKGAEIHVMCDVDNPLCGKDGATYTFGPQKGADEEILKRLEAGMINYQAKLEEVFGKGCCDFKGAGGAGGLGAALTLFCRAEISPGVETVMDMVGLDKALENADFIITGEGRTDWQSAHGKVLAGIGSRAKKHGVPALAIAGGLGRGFEDIYECGIDSIISTAPGPCTLDEAMENAKQLYESAARRLFRIIKAAGRS